MKIKVKALLLSPWLPVWAAILMMANVIAVDILNLTWPMTIVWLNVQYPVECAIAISVIPNIRTFLGPTVHYLFASFG